MEQQNLSKALPHDVCWVYGLTKTLKSVTQHLTGEFANLFYLHRAAENIQPTTSEPLRDDYDSQIPLGFENCIIGVAAYHLHNRKHR